MRNISRNFGYNIFNKEKESRYNNTLYIQLVNNKLHSVHNITIYFTITTMYKI